MASVAWDESRLARPHEVADKASRVRQMFAAIAGRYDLNNRLHSLGQDQRWRRRAVRLSGVKAGETVVDVACGTGDLSFAFARETEASRVIGIDFTPEMLEVARAKGGQAASPKRGRRFTSRAKVEWINGDAQALPLPDASADVVSIAFGLRNVQAPAAALAEFRRVLRPGGRLVVLEFDKPTNGLLRRLNDFYTARVMPISATLISGDRSGAYKYLPQSVATFADRAHLAEMIRAAGFSTVEQTPLTFGVCVCTVALV